MEHTEIIGATLSQHQQALYSLLQEFDRVCRKLNIPYLLFAGTMLGALRHQGFIPWDDDLDVIMHRRDYARFLKDAPAVLNQERFFLRRRGSRSAMPAIARWGSIWSVEAVSVRLRRNAVAPSGST